jgi:hypothetical protein
MTSAQTVIGPSSHETDAHEPRAVAVSEWPHADERLELRAGHDGHFEYLIVALEAHVGGQWVTEAELRIDPGQAEWLAGALSGASAKRRHL